MAVETLRRVVGRYVSRDAKRHLVKDVRTLYAWLAEEEGITTNTYWRASGG